MQKDVAICIKSHYDLSQVTLQSDSKDGVT